MDDERNQTDEDDDASDHVCDDCRDRLAQNADPMETAEVVAPSPQSTGAGLGAAATSSAFTRARVELLPRLDEQSARIQLLELHGFRQKTASLLTQAISQDEAVLICRFLCALGYEGAVQCGQLHTRTYSSQTDRSLQQNPYWKALAGQLDDSSEVHALLRPAQQPASASGPRPASTAATVTRDGLPPSPARAAREVSTGDRTQTASDSGSDSMPELVSTSNSWLELTDGASREIDRFLAVLAARRSGLVPRSSGSRSSVPTTTTVPLHGALDSDEHDEDDADPAAEVPLDALARRMASRRVFLRSMQEYLSDRETRAAEYVRQMGAQALLDTVTLTGCAHDTEDCDHLPEPDTDDESDGV